LHRKYEADEQGDIEELKGFDKTGLMYIHGLH
jgi:hypothetical protein